MMADSHFRSGGTSLASIFSSMPEASSGRPCCRRRFYVLPYEYFLHCQPATLVTTTIGRTGPRRFRITQHHHGVARGRHQVVALLVNAAILAVIQPKFFEPLIQVLQHLEAPALHPNEHAEHYACSRGHILRSLEHSRKFFRRDGTVPSC